MIIAWGQIFKITASRFLNVSEEYINLMKEDAIPRKLTVFLELRSRKTVRFSEQIMSADKYPSIFSRQMKAIVYVLLDEIEQNIVICQLRADQLLAKAEDWGK